MSSTQRKGDKNNDTILSPALLAGYEDFMERFGSPSRSLSPVSSATASQLSSVQDSRVASPSKLKAKAALKRTKSDETAFGLKGTSTTQRMASKKAQVIFSNDEENYFEDDTEISSFSHDDEDVRVKRSKKENRKSSKLRKARSVDDTKSITTAGLFAASITDFHRACQCNHISSLESMFKKGEIADINCLDYLHNTGLHEAVINNHWEVVRLLLRHGASLDIRNLADKTPIDLARTPSLAAFLNEFKMRSIMSKDHKIIGLIWSHQSSKIPALLREEKDPYVQRRLVSESDDLGFSPLHAAAIFDRPDVMKILLKHGANINCKSASGITPLHEACRFSSAESLKFLLESKADISIRNKAGYRAFSMCNKVLRRLFKRTVKESGSDDFDISEPDVLIHFEEASDLSDSDDSGNSDSELADSELNGFRQPRYGATTGGVSREERKLQQMLAIMNKMSPSKKQAKTRTKSRDSHIEEEEEFSDGHFDSSASSPKVKTPVKKSAALKELDAKHVDKSYGTTQLHKHAEKGNLKEVKLLVAKNRKLVKMADNAGYTALHEASLNGHLGIVKFLLESGADIDKSALNGDTPLHDAAENGHVEIVAFLLQAGANRIIKNDDGNTALDVAKNSRVRAMLEVIDSRPSINDLQDAPKVREAKKKASRTKIIDESPPKSTKAKAAVVGKKKIKAEPVPIPMPILNPEALGPLLLVRVGDPIGWFFLSPQIEALFQYGKPDAPASLFRSANKQLFTTLLTTAQRQHLISSPHLKRLADLKEVLSDYSVEIHMLEKDAVYAVFNSYGLSFGSMTVIYLDLQRVLRSSMVDESLLPSASSNPTAANEARPGVIPPKLKMKMQRKGSNAGIVEVPLLVEGSDSHPVV